jgi:hypothetical protein
MALCRCGGNNDGTTGEQSADASEEWPAVVILRDSGGLPNSVEAGDASVDAASVDAAGGDGAFDGARDGTGGDGAVGDGALDDATGDGSSGDAAGGDAAGGDAAGGDAAGGDAAGGDAAGGDGAVDGSGGEASIDAGPPCDATASPKSNACVLDTAYGVFVAVPAGDAGAGSDGGDATAPTVADGSPSKPFGSIAYALARLGGRSRVYVCDGTYKEQLTITTPVSLYGGLSCAGGLWRWDGGSTQVLSPTPDYALSITGLNTAAIDIQDLAFIAPDATAPGASSVAAIIAASSVTLTRVVLAAGRGATGADGVTGKSNWGGQQPPDFGLPGSTVCGNGDSSTGGDGYQTSSGPPASAGTSKPPAQISGAGFDGAPGAINVDGDPGANGWPRSAGEPAGNTGTLALSGNEWLPSQGTDGAPGGPGQGGGGGGAWDQAGNMCSGGCVGGSGGSAGGCGGAGGMGGLGGGGSIALLGNGAAISLVSSTLAASQGGAGGEGGPGEDGQPGAPSEPGMTGEPGANGGAGGHGAGGSGGGGGTGGISVGVLFRGAKPIADATTGITPGVAGAAGSGGVPGSQNQTYAGRAGSPGLPGVSAAYLGPV